MRGSGDQTASLFSYVSCEARVPADHPLSADPRGGGLGAGRTLPRLRRDLRSGRAALDRAGEVAPGAAIAGFFTQSARSGLKAAAYYLIRLPKPLAAAA